MAVTRLDGTVLRPEEGDWGPSLESDDYNVLGVHWQVRGVPAGDPRIDDSYGKMDPNNYVIWLCANMPYEERVETLVHETFHIITKAMKKLDLMVEENLRIFSSVAADTLSRNKVRLFLGE